MGFQGLQPRASSSWGPQANYAQYYVTRRQCHFQNRRWGPGRGALFGQVRIREAVRRQGSAILGPDVDISGSIKPVEGVVVFLFTMLKTDRCWWWVVNGCMLMLMQCLLSRDLTMSWRTVKMVVIRTNSHITVTMCCLRSITAMHWNVWYFRDRWYVYDTVKKVWLRWYLILFIYMM